MRPGPDPGPGEDDHSRADRCLAPLVSRHDVPSLAYAVVRDGDATLGEFGGAGPRTIFEIGSVTKVFTAVLLADMAERGEVRLSDSAARYLPGGTGPVTLADLATQTSGLPRGLRWSALTHPRDPYAAYPAARLVRVARRSLRASSRPTRPSEPRYGLAPASRPGRSAWPGT